MIISIIGANYIIYNWAVSSTVTSVTLGVVFMGRPGAIVIYNDAIIFSMYNRAIDSKEELVKTSKME